MRERIEKGISEGESLKEIAKAIDKDPTTISKEVLKHRSVAVPASRIQSWNPFSSFQNKVFHDSINHIKSS